MNYACFQQDSKNWTKKFNKLLGCIVNQVQKIGENVYCLVRKIQNFCTKVPLIIITIIWKWDKKNGINWCSSIFLVNKFAKKNLHDLDKVGVYMAHKWICHSHSSLQLKLGGLSSILHFRSCMNLKFGYDLMLSITLHNMKFYYQILCKKIYVPILCKSGRNAGI